MTPILGIIASSRLVAAGSLAGYIPGGYPSSGTATNNIDKLLFSTESRSSLSATLTVAKFDIYGFANVAVAGYAAGGRNTSGNDTNSIDKITVPADTLAALGATLGTAVSDGAGYANGSTAGYAVAGYSSVLSAFQNKYQKLTFSNDTTSTIAATTSQTQNAIFGYANSGTAGYCGTRSNSLIQKLLFSNETNSTISAGYNKYNETGFANSGTAGYSCGGVDNSGNETNSIYKLTFSNDTVASIAATLTNTVEAPSGFSNNTIAGYICGGNDGATYYSNIDKLTFSNDTKSTIGATLSAARSGFNSSAFAA